MQADRMEAYEISWQNDKFKNCQDDEMAQYQDFPLKITAFTCHHETELKWEYLTNFLSNT